MSADDVLARIRSALGSVKTPGAYDKVYKDECQFCFDTPESPGGLYINLSTFQAFGESFVELDHQRTGQAIYLHAKWTRVPAEASPPPGAPAVPAAAPTKLAIGVPGGFAVPELAQQTAVVKEHVLVLFPDRLTWPFPHNDLPLGITLAVDQLLAHADVAVTDSVAAWEDERRVSAYAGSLLQEDSTGRKIPRDASLWTDAETGATDNLWLNLSDGYIGGGRRNWDGSGGSGSALRHYQAMRAQGKNYPLVVKLGTITPSGADVYSYAPEEDEMVTDPGLAGHLAHWGIDVMACEKTEKSMAELEIDLNSSFEFDKILESGAQLEKVSGPGLTGLFNLGNSCYMNSLIQVLMHLPEFGPAHAAAATDGAVFRNAPPDPAGDLRVQLAKLAAGLLLPCADPERTAIRPSRFKALVARGHREWSSSRQQDVVEYLQHVICVLDANGITASQGPGPQTLASSLFEFEIETRDEAGATGACRYGRQRESVLRLYIPLDAAENAEDVAASKERQAKRQKLRSEGATAYITAHAGGDAAPVSAAAPGAVAADTDEAPVPPVVPFSACIAHFAAPGHMDGLALGPGLGRGPGLRTHRLASMPRYLALQMGRFAIAPGSWVPHKVDCLVAPPQHLSLEHLRAGPHPDGELLLAGDEGIAAAAPDSAVPMQADGDAGTGAAPVAPDATIVAQLVAMGFSENGSRRAAVATRNAGAEASMDWVLAHMDDADFNEPLPSPTAAASKKAAPGSGLVDQITCLGFPERAAVAALMACDGNTELAADWLLTRDDLDAAVLAAEAAAAEPAAAGPAPAAAPAAVAAPQGDAALDDGPGEYELVGFVSHMGANTACGHYVAHVHKDGRWVLYNDDKVAISKAAPLDLGYLYVYRRV